jgi:hypothetical protein
MTEIRHRKARAVPMFINSSGSFFFRLAAFIIRETKAGREFKTAALKQRHGTWINGYYYSLPASLLFCFLLRVQSFSYLASHSRATAAGAFVAMVVESLTWLARYAWVGGGVLAIEGALGIMLR